MTLNASYCRRFGVRLIATSVDHTHSKRCRDVLVFLLLFADRLDEDAFAIDLFQFGRLLPGDLGAMEACVGSSFTSPLVAKEIHREDHSKPLSLRKVMDLDRGSEIATPTFRPSTSDKSAQLWSLLYSDEFTLKLNIPDTLIFRNGAFESCIYSSSKSLHGGVQRSKRRMDATEQSNR